MIDVQGDGIPDKVYIMFERKLKPKDIFDSIVTVWGDPGITRTFVTTADTTGGIIKPKENYWTIRDSVSAPFKVMLADSTTKDSTNTYSIIEINIPDNLAYPRGSTSGEKDGNGMVSPLKGAANGFFETTYTLYDKCPPIITSARMIKNLLTVNISENVTMLETGKYIVRERDNYIPPERPQGAGKTYLFTYNEKDNVVHAGDMIKLVPENIGSAYIDKNSNIPRRIRIQSLLGYRTALHRYRICVQYRSRQRRHFRHSHPVPLRENWRSQGKDNVLFHGREQRRANYSR